MKGKLKLKNKFFISVTFAVSIFCLSISNLFAEIDTNQIYIDKCNMCHGEDGKGTKQGKDFGVPDLTDAEWQSTRTNEDFINSITNGNPDNPFYLPFGDMLSEEEIAAMAAHIRKFAQ